MSTPFFFYADEASQAVLESQMEKAVLVGGDFNARNFGDILQQVNTIALHREMGRRKTVALMGMGAVCDDRFPELVRTSSGADALLFFAGSESDESAARLGLHPVRGACNVSCLHLYGGGFLNDKWGDIVLGVTEYLLRVLEPPLYVVSGQQITAPYHGRVAGHIRSHAPSLFGVRDKLSLQCLSSAGQSAEFSFDDATEALQQLTKALPLRRGPGLLMQLNVSDYTGNASGPDPLSAELETLARHPPSSHGLTVLQAYSDRRIEILDSRESIKFLERAFPFPDYRTLELSHLAYLSSGPLANPLQGEIGYSCSYHVALWLQLSGIPCWLRGSNDFYAQKREALQVDQTLEAFLREPRLADHSANVERRQAWSRQLTETLDKAPESRVVRDLGRSGMSTAKPAARRPNVQDGSTASALSCIGRTPAQYNNMYSLAPPPHIHALNQQITELGHLAHSYRARAEAAEAELSDLRKRPALLVEETVRLHLEVANLTQTLAQRDATAQDLQQQVSTFIQTLAQRDATVQDLQQQVSTFSKKLAEAEAMLGDRARELIQSRSDAASLFNQLNQILHSHSWRLTRPLRIAMRFVRHGHLDAAGDVGVFQLARWVGRRLPLPVWIKANIRSSLLKWRFHGVTEQLAHATTLPLNYQSIGEISKPDRPMSADCCGLQHGLVSVILPVFNQAYLLDESIQSVLGQTYQDFELIVINDGSTDSVESVLERYRDHPKVRCFSQANQRLPKALSNGFSFARGEFWTWTSADNIMEPRMLELLVGKLRAEPDLGMVYADYYAIDDRGALLQDTTWRTHNRPDPESAEIRLPHTTEKLNTVQDNFIGPCFMYRGWIGRCMGDYDPQLGIEDYDYWMRINAFFPIRHLGSPELLYRYRVHDNTLSAQASEHRILEKVQRLMDYERKRAAFYRERMVVVADAVGLEWINSTGALAAELQSLYDSSGRLLGTEELARADLVLLCSASAAAIRSELSELETPIAILFEADERKHQKLQHLLNRPGSLALAPSRLTANRVRLVADCPIVDADSALTLDAVVAFAKNYQYFHKTRSTEELQRQLPRQLVHPDGQHVLLQVDSFMQGGMENVVIDLALSLQETGFQVTIANLGSAGDAADKARENGLRVETFGNRFSAAAYIDWLQQQRVTLVNAHYSIFGAAECGAAGIPFIETIHNAYVWLDEGGIRSYQAADPHISGYICVSKTAALYADVVLGLDVSKMRVIPNGIDSQNVNATNFASNRNELRREWNIPADAPVFLNVASIMATKAQLPLVKAFARVVHKHPEARLVLLGSVMEKAYQQAVEKAVREMKLQQSVIFAGYHRDVARYYHAADVFVLPSYWEGWSLSLGEAMANGLSCVITDVGSAYEFEGNPRVEIVPAPFGDITALNRDNLGQHVYGEDEDFIESLANAMLRATGHRRGPVDIDLAQRLDRRIAYRQYAEAFSSFHIDV